MGKNLIFRGVGTALITPMKNEKILLPTGALRYTLTNDFLFKAFLQQNEEALKGLLCALLDLKYKR